MSGQIHDNYGKTLVREIAAGRFISKGKSVRVNYGGNVSATIDGVIENCCAIEIESRTTKQVRGALLDLIEHPLPKKLLILIPAYMYNPENTVKHCLYILNRYKQKDHSVKSCIT